MSTLNNTLFQKKFKDKGYNYDIKYASNEYILTRRYTAKYLKLLRYTINNQEYTIIKDT